MTDQLRTIFSVLLGQLAGILPPVMTALVFLLLAYGLYQVLSDFLNVPSRGAKKAVLAVERKKRTFFESLTIPLAERIETIYKMDEQKKSSLQKKLYSAQIHYSPEFYMSKALAEGLLVGLLAVPMYFIFPLFSLLMIIIGILCYYRRIEELDEMIRNKSEKIDRELPMFADMIKQQLATSRDVMSILVSYRKICGEELVHELDMTIADMKTGHYEKALKNLEMRIPSVGLSEIIRGLLAVLRGDDQRGYFEMLAHDLAVSDKERIKRIALKRPDKLKPVGILLVGAFLAMYIYVIGHQIFTHMQEIF